MKVLLTIIAVVAGVIAFVAVLLAVWTDQHTQWFFTALLFGAVAAFSAVESSFRT